MKFTFLHEVFSDSFQLSMIFPSFKASKHSPLNSCLFLQTFMQYAHSPPKNNHYNHVSWGERLCLTHCLPTPRPGSNALSMVSAPWILLKRRGLFSSYLGWNLSQYLPAILPGSLDHTEHSHTMAVAKQRHSFPLSGMCCKQSWANWLGVRNRWLMKFLLVLKQ